MIIYDKLICKKQLTLYLANAIPPPFIFALLTYPCIIPLFFDFLKYRYRIIHTPFLIVDMIQKFVYNYFIYNHTNSFN